MNWGKWLPWRDEQTNDSNYESKVKDRCNHTPEWTEVKHSKRYLATPGVGDEISSLFFAPYIENGHAIFKTVVMKEAYCEYCGKLLEGPKPQYDEDVAIQLDYEIGEGAEINDIMEKDDDGERIIVNEDAQEGAPVVPVQPKEADDEQPYGTTD